VNRAKARARRIHAAQRNRANRDRAKARKFKQKAKRMKTVVERMMGSLAMMSTKGRKQALLETVTPPKRLKCAVSKIELRKVHGYDFFPALKAFGDIAKYETMAIKLNQEKHSGLMMSTQFSDVSSKEFKSSDTRCLSVDPTVTRASCNKMKKNTNLGKVVMVPCSTKSESNTWTAIHVKDKLQIRLQRNVFLNQCNKLDGISIRKNQTSIGNECLSAENYAWQKARVALAPCGNNTLWEYNPRSQQLMTRSQQLMTRSQQLMTGCLMTRSRRKNRQRPNRVQCLERGELQGEIRIRQCVPKQSGKEMDIGDAVLRKKSKKVKRTSKKQIKKLDPDLDIAYQRQRWGPEDRAHGKKMVEAVNAWDRILAQISAMSV